MAGVEAAGGQGSWHGDPRGRGKDRWGLGREPAQLAAFWPQSRARRVSHCRAEVGRVTSWCPRKLRISQPCNSQPHPPRFGDQGSQSPLAIRGPGFCSEALDAFLQQGSASTFTDGFRGFAVCPVEPATGCNCSETPSLLHEGLSLEKSLRKAPPQETKMTGVARGDLEDIHPQPH